MAWEQGVSHLAGQGQIQRAPGHSKDKVTGLPLFLLPVFAFCLYSVVM